VGCWLEVVGWRLLFGDVDMDDDACAERRRFHEFQVGRVDSVEETLTASHGDGEEPELCSSFQYGAPHFSGELMTPSSVTNVDSINLLTPILLYNAEPLGIFAPISLTSFSPAAALARRSALSRPWVTKMKEVRFGGQSTWPRSPPAPGSHLAPSVRSS
jgi:hypothetical protein